MAINGTFPNGSANAPVEASSQPTVVGINFGNSYASIAEGLAESIANEDGERQIACAISFHGEETYIGNQAKAQLVKNASNTIVGFRNLLGKKFSELPKDKSTTSAPIIQHPDVPDEPAYKVQVLQASPSPLPPSALTTKTNTPAVSQTATPRSEPAPVDRILTPSEVATIFLKSLLQSAEDFLGKKVEGAVITVPGWFDEKQLAAVRQVAENAGINVLQLLEDAGASAVTTTAGPLADGLNPDRTQLVVDLGASSLSLTLLSIRHGLFHILASSYDSNIGGDQIDDKLIKFFAKEFTKKTKTPLTVCPSTDKADVRAEARLRLALEHTKRTISASPGAATCSVESLKDGLDFTGTINRMRFDMEARSVYSAVYAKAQELLASADLDFLHVDEIVYVGGSASLPGLDETLAQGVQESTVTPFTAGTVIGGGIGDPTTLLARGAALQAKLLAQIGHSGEDEEVRKAFEQGSTWVRAKATTRSIGILFPEESSDAELGGQWIGVIPRETAVPARRNIAFDVDLGEDGGPHRVGFEVWEVKEGVKVEKVKPPKDEDEEPLDEDEEEEEIEVKEKTIEKEGYLASVVVETKNAKKQKGRWRTRLEVQFLLGADGSVEVSAWEVGTAVSGEKASVSVPPL
ncbi:actin-like ATPase domain-containing protein [Auriscalpium vulgare]|uniref:Actin-like ATPase domain-containing protein n=1 Tax=Auriscalpium vulgare TaxID=40419 RepID=A0ACB8RHZ1_9AGAM|nr:actin-like ATPase domain-containing protein [Auriscalpium vulgare]